MLLCLIGKYCFHISPTPECRGIAIRSQFDAERQGLFEGQDTFHDEAPSEVHYGCIDYIFSRQERRNYSIVEVLSWIKKDFK